MVAHDEKCWRARRRPWNDARVTFHLAELVQPGDDAPGALLTAFEAFAAMTRARSMATYGNDDLAYTGSVVCGNFRDSAESRRLAIIAIAGPQPTDVPTDADGRRLLDATAQLAQDDVIGMAMLTMPMLDNLNALSVQIEVDAAWYRRGVGRALYEAAEDYARAHGRTVLECFTDNHEGTGPDTVRPKEGPFGLAPDGSTAFAQAMGFSLAQAERHSMLELADVQLGDAEPPAGYRYVTWNDHTPDEYLDLVAPLYAGMSTDTPRGEHEWEPEIWDADRVRTFDADHLRAQQAVTTLAISDAGESAGFTQLFWDPTKPTMVDQWNTIVAKDHRGHGLGLGLKQANLVAAMERWPTARRVHTWNAAENDHMWAINEQLGYRVASIDGGWQKKLSQPTV